MTVSCTQQLISSLFQYGYNPLHVTVIYRRHGMLEQLLQRKEALGLDVNIKSNTETVRPLLKLIWCCGVAYNYIRNVAREGENLI